MKTVKILAIVVVLVAVVCAFVYYKKDNGIDSYVGQKVDSAKFVCEEGKTIEAIFTTDTVSLKLDGSADSYTYPQLESAQSGAHYGNEDGTFLFWVFGDSAGIRQDRAVTYSKCLGGETRKVFDGVKDLPLPDGLGQPVLGGSWYLADLTLAPLEKTGTAFFEDGHIQKKIWFSYGIKGDKVSIEYDKVSSDSKSEEPVFCTQDAKQCPDGSYVGRVGPSCEFAACSGN